MSGNLSFTVNSSTTMVFVRAVNSSNCETSISIYMLIVILLLLILVNKSNRNRMYSAARHSLDNGKYLLSYVSNGYSIVGSGNIVSNTVSSQVEIDTIVLEEDLGTEHVDISEDLTCKTSYAKEIKEVRDFEHFLKSEV
jgi:hypothetical protein